MRRMKNRRMPGGERTVPLFPLILLTGFFLFGLILGQVLCARIPGETAQELTRYLTDYLQLGEGTGRSVKALLSALLIYFRYPLLAFLLGFSSVGILLLPAVSAVYGFFLSFSVCCFIAVFGTGGALLAVSVLGVRCLFALPCDFVLAVPAFQTSASLAAVSFGGGRRAAPVVYGSKWWARLFTAVSILLAGTVAELFLTPFLLRFALERVL